MDEPMDALSDDGNVPLDEDLRDEVRINKIGPSKDHNLLLGFNFRENEEIVEEEGIIIEAARGK